ncbi:hypothetical protein GPROT1_00484 [Gammaproteobacteria bacterium]|nr:hypothetical protein GPROT1_00484 [Gammaproteobacteria bacterium]
MENVQPNRHYGISVKCGAKIGYGILERCCVSILTGFARKNGMSHEDVIRDNLFDLRAFQTHQSGLRRFCKSVLLELNIRYATVSIPDTNQTAVVSIMG